jgi:glucose-1-phosphate thymidylyltransferase
VKAVVLARGRGTRMREGDAAGAHLTEGQRQAARAGWKTLMPVGRYTFLDFVLSSLADAGCEDAALVIGQEQRDAFHGYEGLRRTRRIRVSLVEQLEPLGTADAVRSASSWTGDAPFLVVNGDNLYPVDALASLCALDGPGLAAFDPAELVRLGNIPAARVSAFALVRVRRDGALDQIVEKPSIGEAAALGDALVSMNAWRFDRRVVDACRDVPPSARGEYELPDAVGLAIARGVSFMVVRASGAVLDLSGPADIEHVARRLSDVVPRP